MTAFETDKMSIIHEMEKTIKDEFMTRSLNAIKNDIDVEDMVAFLNGDDELYERFDEIIRELIDEFLVYIFKGFEMMSTACNNNSCDIDEFAEDIMDYMYDEIDNIYGCDDVKPSMIISRWGYIILQDYVCVTEVFEECFERDNEIKGGIEVFQSLWRGYDCRWKNPFMLLKESIDE